VTTAIFLHGNPGTPEDFDLVRAEPAMADTRIVAPARPQGATLNDLIGELDRLVGDHRAGGVTVVGYSWGAYWALQHAASGRHQPDRLVLVNPYLVVENPLSALAPIALGLPAIGAAILRRSASKWTDEFITGSFRPVSPSPELRTELAGRLDDPDRWRAAVHDKRLQQANPLAPLRELSCATVVLRGERDEVGHWERQSTVLAPVASGIDETVVPGAGHALLWTHPAEVAAAISSARSAS
jgi:pimeloyl-ACP methyl ester carboxylesterase